MSYYYNQCAQLLCCAALVTACCGWNEALTRRPGVVYVRSSLSNNHINAVPSVAELEIGKMERV